LLDVGETVIWFFLFTTGFQFYRCTTLLKPSEMFRYIKGVAIDVCIKKNVSNTDIAMDIEQ